MLDVRKRLGSFEQPALVLFSDSDPIFSRRAAEVMAELLPNAELDPPVEGAGHFLQEDRGEVVGRRIAEWLSAQMKPEARRVRRRADARRLRELAQDVRDVTVHRVLAEHERRGDLAVRHAGRDEPQHLGLA